MGNSTVRVSTSLVKDSASAFSGAYLSLSNDFDHMGLSCSEHFYWELIQKDAVPCFAPDPGNVCRYADAVNEHRYPAT
jgi:hypothetical protein